MTRAPHDPPPVHAPDASARALARLAEHVVELGEGAWVAWVRDVLPDHDALRAELAATLPLRVETLRMGAREVATPRRTSWHGEPGRTYAYSGRRFEPAPWTHALLRIRASVEERTGTLFDAALVNEYRDGRDAMGWHADDEPELGPRAPDDVLIASVSLGAPRRFLLRHRRRPERLEWALGEGDLFVMGGATQRRWQHAIPRTARPVGARVNVTFRLVRPSR